MTSLHVLTQAPDEVACGTGVTDGRGRAVRYLRMSVTDRCDMACVYCMPVGYQGSPRAELLSFEEMVRVAVAFRAVGVRTVRLTGGEPLVRRDLVSLVAAMSRAAPGMDLALTTNAGLLERFAGPLREAGLTRINVSVDSVRDDDFRRITRGGEWRAVRAGILAARTAGFTELKTNTVVLRHENLSQVREIAQWALAHALVPRFIELMPLGEGAALMANHVPWAEVRDALGDLLGEAPPDHPADRGPAFYLPARGGGRVGFITAVSNQFCDVCDRIRMTAKGELRACLASPDGLSLRDVMRAGATDDELVAVLRDVLAGKTAHRFTESGFGQAPGVVMTGIGG
ncbi:MAG: GTP 3',8-cyclase MoaA [Deltaproteobacteria bacterium]|nr:GTP 3',8-cyclase MoaA [Deltaproteobacteria bacterium]